MMCELTCVMFGEDGFGAKVVSIKREVWAVIGIACLKLVAPALLEEGYFVGEAPLLLGSVFEPTTCRLVVVQLGKGSPYHQVARLAST